MNQFRWQQKNNRAVIFSTRYRRHCFALCNSSLTRFSVIAFIFVFLLSFSYFYTSNRNAKFNDRTVNLDPKLNAWFYEEDRALAESLEQRAYREMHLHLEKITNQSASKSPISFEQLQHQVTHRENILYPWAKKWPSLMQMKHSFAGRGIAIAVSSFYVPFAMVLLENLRLLNNKLPIIGYYYGDTELSAEEREMLAEHGLATIVNLLDVFNNTQIDAQRWAAKPFAALAAPFREVMVADADVIFLKKPELLYEHPVYLERRTLFFRDRSVYLKPSREKFLNSLIPKPFSKFLKESRMYQDEVGHEQDSSVVLMDKVDRFYSLLATCKLNSEPLRSVVYKETHGDKETFFLGSELIGEPYGFNSHFPGVIGDNKTADGVTQVCGRVLQFGNSGEPFFSNGVFAGERVDEQAWSRPPFAYRHWALSDGVHTKDGCLRNSSRIIRVDRQTEQLLEKLTQYWTNHVTALT